MLSDAKQILKTDADSVSLITQVTGLIRENLNWEGLNRIFIADKIHMNPDYLSYLFHKQSGQSLVSFINTERISLAKTLLLTTDRTMAYIAETAGYFNISYFYRQFKKITGMTPKQYRDSGKRNS